MEKEIYLGDGLYASFDGWQLCLRAPRIDSEHFVFMEPQVVEEFLKFLDVIRKQSFDGQK